jgi:hypothetical protein
MYLFVVSSTACTSSYGDAETAGSISLQAGETVTCVFTNQKLGKIVLVKETLGGDGTFEFDTTGGSTLPADISINTSGGLGMAMYANIDPDNTYSIEEVIPTGWELNTPACDSSETNDNIELRRRECVFLRRKTLGCPRFLDDRHPMRVPSADSGTRLYDRTTPFQEFRKFFLKNFHLPY